MGRMNGSQTMPVKTAPPDTSRQIVLGLIQAEIAQQRQFSPPVLARLITQKVAADPDLYASIVDVAVYTWVYRCVSDTVTWSRTKAIGDISEPELGSPEWKTEMRAQAEEQHQAALKRDAERDERVQGDLGHINEYLWQNDKSAWAQWFENVSQVQLRLPEMTREQLIFASQRRARNADVEQGLSTLWRRLADGMRPGQRVRDVYTPDDIGRIAQSLFQQIPA